MLTHLMLKKHINTVNAKNALTQLMLKNVLTQSMLKKHVNTVNVNRVK
jgi:hypothetical protein